MFYIEDSHKYEKLLVLMRSIQSTVQRILENQVMEVISFRVLWD